MTANKLATGFFHSFVSNTQDRAFGLFILNGCLVIELLYLIRAMQLKTYMVFYFFIYLSKALLNFQLFVQIWQPLTLYNGLTSENSLILVLLIFGLMLILYIINISRVMYLKVQRIIVGRPLTKVAKV